MSTGAGNQSGALAQENQLAGKATVGNVCIAYAQCKLQLPEVERPLEVARNQLGQEGDAAGLQHYLSANAAHTFPERLRRPQTARRFARAGGRYPGGRTNRGRQVQSADLYIAVQIDGLLQ